jgi:hypothetical protein
LTATRTIRRNSVIWCALRTLCSSATNRAVRCTVFAFLIKFILKLSRSAQYTLFPIVTDLSNITTAFFICQSKVISPACWTTCCWGASRAARWAVDTDFVWKVLTLRARGRLKMYLRWVLLEFFWWWLQEGWQIWILQFAKIHFFFLCIHIRELVVS